MRHQTPGLFTLGIALALAAPACGDDDSGTPSKPYF